FHSLVGNTKDVEKAKRIAEGKPGSPCPKKFVALNKDFKEKGLCTASRQYQAAKLKELESQELPKSEFEYQYNKITEKSCTCVGLGTAALLAYNLDTREEGEGVSICPGPNMAYFSKVTSLAEMIDHVYGRMNVMSRTDRPNMFIKELQIYLQYYQEQIEELKRNSTEKQRKKLITFGANLLDGIVYYENLLVPEEAESQPSPTCIAVQLHGSRIVINSLMQSLEAAETEVVC
ncbi:unnamed protein product, partial [Ectocarpus sp. 12 AP-2014]